MTNPRDLSSDHGSGSRSPSRLGRGFDESQIRALVFLGLGSRFRPDFRFRFELELKSESSHVQAHSRVSGSGSCTNFVLDLAQTRFTHKLLHTLSLVLTLVLALALEQMLTWIELWLDQLQSLTHAQARIRLG